MEPLVSIIVPVYNAENFMVRCIDSILNQEYRNFELLLVDDGSTDHTGAICDSYAGKDHRVKVFHQENQGVSQARNYALDHASGEYIQFLDSDDWISPEATKLFVRHALEYHCDLVISDFYRVSGNRISHKGDIEEDHVLTKQEFANIMLENPADFYYGVLWNKFFRRDIIESIHLRMDPKISWCEDFLFNLEYIRHANSFFALQVPIYYYVKRKGSLVSTQSASLTNTMKMKLNVFEYYNQFYKDVYDKETYDNIRPQVYRFFFTSAKDGMVPITPLPGSQKLGEERPVFSKNALEKDGILMDAYRDRKLLEYYLQTVAKKHDLTEEETLVLFYIHHLDCFSNIKELAEYMHCSSRMVSSTLQKLAKKELIQIPSGKKITTVSLLPDSDAILKDLSHVEHDYDAICFSGFSPEEKELYQSLAKRIQTNIKDTLGRF